MVSIVIPTLDEERRITSCLDAAVPQATEIGAEVLVVDGGSRDATLKLAQRDGVRVLRGRTGRGVQMNHGARAARGSLLLFLPADTCLPHGALRAVAAIHRDRRVRAGGFRQRFDSSNVVLRCVSYLTNLRARLTGVVYGDQVLFIERELFFELGGFLEGIDMEDLEFGSRLKRIVRPRLLPQTVVTSARRFERTGPLRATASAAYILASWTLFGRIPRSRTFFTPVR